MHVLALTATCGRHTLIERSVALFINQDYEGLSTLIIYNNSPEKQELGDMYLRDNQEVILVNQHIDSKTGKPYTSLGAIYNDILHSVDLPYDVMYHHDDDDLFLQNHISEGVKGLLLGSKTAYKPKYSWYRSSEGLVPTQNVLEPSIFVRLDHLKKYGYSLVTAEQHMQWLSPLEKSKELVVSTEGVPTLIYNWGDELFTFKTSGDFHNPENFNNYRYYSKDHGDHIITPWKPEDIQPYYNEVENVKKSKNLTSFRSPDK